MNVLTTSEVAELLGCRPDAARMLLEAAGVPHRRVSTTGRGAILWDALAVESLAATLREVAAAPAGRGGRRA